MTKANRLGMYADVRQVLDAALAHGGGEFECTSHGAAVHWRQRAYRFRKVYAETIGLKRESQYDVLVLPRIPPSSAIVRIEIRQVAGVFRPANVVFDDETDPALEAAFALAAQIEKGEL